MCIKRKISLLLFLPSAAWIYTSEGANANGFLYYLPNDDLI